MQQIAQHVLNIHMNRADTQTEVVGEIGIEKMKRYIAYCKAYAETLLTLRIGLTTSAGNARLACLLRQPISSAAILWRYGNRSNKSRETIMNEAPSPSQCGA